MKFMVQLILIAILAYILDIFLPWYSVAIAAFAVSVAIQSKSNFLAGFFAIALLWFFAASFIDSHSSSGLADRVAMILHVNKTIWLMVITAVLGGLVAGFAAMTGSSLRTQKRRY